MGREIKRVALDFSWPVGHVWEGYVSPEWRDCPEDCQGGYSKAYRMMEPAINNLMWHRDVMNSREYTQITTFLAGRKPTGPIGHDSMDKWHAILKLGELAGLPKDWHECPVCHGHGIHPDDYPASEAWKKTEPPAGEGWQVWETVSEGSPISPVFATAIECAEWVSKHEHCSPEAAQKFVANGWAPSMVMGPSGIKTGPQMYEDEA